MTDRKKKERTERVKKMNAVLQKLYPEATIALNYSSDWELLVAVQLSAQCTDERVNTVTQKLFKQYPTLDAYANATQSEMQKAEDQFGGRVPDAMEKLLTIPGVARKTANVVLSCLYGKAEGIAVDTHVRRFAIRFDLSDHSDPVRIERDLMEIMPQKEWWGFNHRLVHYGRDYCPARPHECSTHPLTKIYPEAAHVWPTAK